MPLPNWVYWTGAIADIVAGLALAYPAIRLSRQMLLMHRISAESNGEQPVLEELETEYVDSFSKLLSQWDPLDHRLLKIGFAAFLVSAGMRLNEVAILY